ncbi:MAG TPA: hypothetical protein VGJ94_01940 [Syntrophorhabdaceae bacterium]|jgi:hypothetical protein
MEKRENMVFGGSQEDLPKVRLKVVDRETNESRYCDIEATEGWDWSNPELWRVINGWQITSYGMLLFMLRQKEEKGLDEVVLQEIPAFMMLNGS